MSEQVCAASPCFVSENVASAEAEDARRLVGHFAVCVEDAVPRIEKNLAANVGHRQIGVRALDERLQALSARVQERFVCAAEPSTCRLTITRVISAANAVHVPRERLIQRHQLDLIDG